jgi:hypothetical protein
MSAIIIPEVVIYNTLNSLITFLREDIRINDAQNTKEESILWHILGQNEDGNKLTLNVYNFYDQAKKMLTTHGNLRINYGYSAETAKNLSLHIMLPAETNAGSGLGEDEGYMEDISDNIPYRFTQNFEANYQIMITSDNSSECMVMYHLLKTMILAVVPHWELQGLRIPRISGGDIVMEQDLTPFMIFHKIINLTFMYEHTVPQLILKKIANSINFVGWPQNYQEGQVYVNL